MIIGQGALLGKKGEEFLNLCINLAHKYNFLNEDWNGFNVLHSAASRPGAMSIGFLPSKEGQNTEEIIDNYNKGDIELLYLLGADELNLKHNKESFVIYQGHHGDSGAENADLILPSPAFCEQNGLYMNTEGRVQESIRSIFPLGEAKEDWKIFSMLSEALSFDFKYKDLNQLRDKIFKELPNLNPFSLYEKGSIPEKINFKEIKGHNFRKVISNYWRSNSIARASNNLSKRNNYKLKGIER